MDPDPLFRVANVEDVDMESTPMTAEQYLAQVVAARKQQPRVVRAVVKRQRSCEDRTTAAPSISSSSRDPHAPSVEWITAKLSLFGRHREAVEKRRETSRPIKGVTWPPLLEPTEWYSIAMNECIPEATPFKSFFPHHKGTPPAPAVLFTLSSSQQAALLSALVEEWPGEYDRCLFEWIHALLLVADRPLLQDVCSSLRAFARRLKVLRASENDARKFECSFLIAIIANYFSQFDLAD